MYVLRCKYSSIAPFYILTELIPWLIQDLCLSGIRLSFFPIFPFNFIITFTQIYINAYICM
jgi:hypothetical protein